MSSADITVHNVKEIWINNSESTGTHWFSVKVVTDRDEVVELSLFGIGALPEIKFGDK